MCKSVNTIRYYKRQVFNKLKVKNTNQAIAKSIHYGILLSPWFPQSKSDLYEQ